VNGAGGSRIFAAPRRDAPDRSESVRALPKALVAALVGFVALAGARSAQAQRPPEQLDAAEILHRMQELGVLGSVLYLAAHPDDENTRLISCLSNGRQVRTAYLSLTRGDGGQNLIGEELGDALGILRTQELCEARRIDGGEQFFTRAVDFGFSKSPEEALAKWGKQEVLADVVRVVRTFRPDAIVTRFATDGSGGHGHHTASALLASEAFDLAADPRAFPEQIAEGLEPWQTRRLFFNASTWWTPDLAGEARKDPARWVAVDVGGFDSLLGTSYTELAGKSRSQHKSQGFGAAETRGEQLEYLRLEKGAPLAQRDLLDGVDLGWSRVAGGARAGELVDGLVAAYDLRSPEASLPRLAELARELDRLAAGAGPASVWARHHAAAARELLLQVAGLAIEATTDVASVARGASLAVSLRATQRRAGPEIELLRVEGPGGASASVGEILPVNRPLEVGLTLATELGGIDQPYWLVGSHGNLFTAAAGESGIAPFSRPLCALRAFLRLPGGLELEVERPLMHTWVDRVAGQRTRTVGVTPIASIEPVDPVVLVRGERVEVGVDVVALGDDVSGHVGVLLPGGWSAEGGPLAVEHLARGERRRFTLDLRPGPGASGGRLHVSFAGPGGGSDWTMHVIDHPHVLPQTWYTPADVRLVPLEIEVGVRTVGFVEGAGDDMPRALQRLGLAVERIDPASARPGDLETYDAIVTGIRAYDTVPALARFQPLLLEWVAGGGTLLVQYNTPGSDLVLDPRALGPKPFVISRGRVTVEEAPATLLAPEHPLLSTPNRIGPADFAGWVQERGLYFADELDPAYTPLIAWNDPGEAPLVGGLVTIEHGQGRFTYTGISFFRQLPAGVPGAYRLLANLLERRAPRARTASAR
jgi:LmbE family N-acetylglucosaminyl deacetylase